MTKGYPQRTEPLPLAFDKVDAEWLSRTLALRYPGVVVEAMRLVQLIPGHTTKARIEADFNAAGIAAGLPAQLCLKANWSGSPLSSPVCINEARFYHDFRERMELPSPHCHFADWDDAPDGQQGFIILDDLIPQRVDFGHSARPIGLDAAARALTAMAALHGTTWHHPELQRHAWLQTAMAPGTVTDDYWSMMEAQFAAHNALPERLAIFPRWMAEDPQRLRSAFRQLCARETADPSPLCLVHGDAHLGNSFATPSGERQWFDWQIVRKGRPWRDYSYFVIGSISVEDRRHGERDLLQHYLAALAAHDVAIDAATAWDDYRRWVIWGLVGWQSNINPTQATMPALERFCRAADDLDTASFYRF